MAHHPTGMYLLTIPGLSVGGSASGYLLLKRSDITGDSDASVHKRAAMLFYLKILHTFVLEQRLKHGLVAEGGVINDSATCAVTYDGHDAAVAAGLDQKLQAMGEELKIIRGKLNAARTATDQDLDAGTIFKSQTSRACTGSRAQPYRRSEIPD